MEPSPEICRVVERWLVAGRDNDPDTFVGKMSAHPGVLVIGTDEEEWWHRQDEAVWRRQLEESGGFPFAWDEIEAWEEGSVGWAGARLALNFPQGTYPVRMTWVLHLEQGEWKMVQLHLSGFRSNVEMWGRELTVSLEQLEETIRRDRPDLSGDLATDGTVTIVFTDIVDSTVMLTRLGDRAYLDAVRRHHDVISEVATSHGGTVVETQGDGSMLAFSSARRAVACASAIQSEIDRTFADMSPPLSVRIGIHTGDVLKEADHFYGTTVHYAARVASNAVGGEVLVSNLVRELVAGSDVSFRDTREVELKGIEGSHSVFAVDLAQIG
jgi:class 3 adenylate cyclase